MSMRDHLGAGLMGGAAGIGATVGMSVLMVAARRAGLLSTLPPHDIAEQVAERALPGHDVGGTERAALGWVSHLAFGAASGAIYAIGRGLLRPSTPAALDGLAYALSVWAVSYLGWIPLLRLLPSAIDDRPGRPATMIAAHVVFGLLLASLVDRARRADRR